MRALRNRAVVPVAALFVLAGCSASAMSGHGDVGRPLTSTSSHRSGGSGSSGVPGFDHIVVVWETHLSFAQFVAHTDAPYLHSLARGGALLTDMHALGHPAKLNYITIFSGDTHVITTDDCPLQLSGPNLAVALADRHLSFVGYSEGLPRVGAGECRVGNYVREHNPWVDFTNVPKSANQPFTAFPADFTKLPAVAFVVPNLLDDMHDGTVAAADAWLRTHMGAYARWAATHNSLLIVAWDHVLPSADPSNHIPEIFAGAHVRAGAEFRQPADHLTVLRTIEDAFGLAPLGASAERQPVSGIWK